MPNPPGRPRGNNGGHPNRYTHYPNPIPSSTDAANSYISDRLGTRRPWMVAAQDNSGNNAAVNRPGYRTSGPTPAERAPLVRRSTNPSIHAVNTSNLAARKASMPTPTGTVNPHEALVLRGTNGSGGGTSNDDPIVLDNSQPSQLEGSPPPLVNPTERLPNNADNNSGGNPNENNTETMPASNDKDNAENGSANQEAASPQQTDTAQEPVLGGPDAAVLQSPAPSGDGQSPSSAANDGVDDHRAHTAASGVSETPHAQADGNSRTEPPTVNGEEQPAKSCFATKGVIQELTQLLASRPLSAPLATRCFWIMKAMELGDLDFLLFHQAVCAATVDEQFRTLLGAFLGPRGPRDTELDLKFCIQLFENSDGLALPDIWEPFETKLNTLCASYPLANAEMLFKLDEMSKVALELFPGAQSTHDKLKNGALSIKNILTLLYLGRRAYTRIVNFATQCRRGIEEADYQQYVFYKAKSATLNQILRFKPKEVMGCPQIMESINTRQYEPLLKTVCDVCLANPKDIPRPRPGSKVMPANKTGSATTIQAAVVNNNVVSAGGLPSPVTNQAQPTGLNQTQPVTPNQAQPRQIALGRGHPLPPAARQPHPLPTGPILPSQLVTHQLPPGRNSFSPFAPMPPANGRPQAVQGHAPETTVTSPIGPGGIVHGTFSAAQQAAAIAAMFARRASNGQGQTGFAAPPPMQPMTVGAALAHGNPVQMNAAPMFGNAPGQISPTGAPAQRLPRAISEPPVIPGADAAWKIPSLPQLEQEVYRKVQYFCGLKSAEHFYSTSGMLFDIPPAVYQAVSKLQPNALGRNARTISNGSVMARIKCVDKNDPTLDLANDAVWYLREHMWPDTAFLSLNNEPLYLRRRNAYRNHFPCDITNSIVPGTNKIAIAIMHDFRNPSSHSRYRFSVELLETMAFSAVISNAWTNRVPFMSTYNTLLSKLNKHQSDDDDIIVEMVSMKLSLVDPISMSVMTIPVRSRNCKHLECFDLWTYLVSRPRKAPREPPNPDGYKCPICSGSARPKELILDSLVADMISISKYMQIEARTFSLKEDGSWKLLDEDGLSTGDRGQGQKRSADQAFGDGENENEPKRSAPREVISLDDD